MKGTPRCANSRGRGRTVEEFDMSESSGRTMCSIDDCFRSVRARGLCNTHNLRWLSTGVLGGPIEDRRRNVGSTCSVVECERPAKSRGWCQAHYLRWYATGTEPAGPVVQIHRRHDEVTYSGVHMRLRSDLGLAATYDCADCGKAAEEWSYNHSDPGELINSAGLAYSLSVEHYAPRCRKCHFSFDREHGRQWRFHG